jgi:cell wall-associated NlpC family hydrolase
MTIAHERAEILRIAATWLRTPYRHGQRVKGHGVDCAQILIAIYSEAGLIEPFTPDTYAGDWHLHHREERYTAVIERFADPVDRPEPGDVSVWRFGYTFSHGAVVMSWPTVLHAVKAEGRVSMAEADRGEWARLPTGLPRPVKFYSVFARRARGAAQVAA